MIQLRQHLPSRFGVLLALAVPVAITVLAGAASAHVEPTSTTGESGRRADIGFVPTHGCGTAATIGVDIQLPDDVVDPIPAGPDGWNARIEGKVVTWDGGPLPDGDEATFSVNVLLPDAPGVTLFFPTIQRCAGDEALAWIQRPDDGTDQAFPAPRLSVVEATGPPGTTTPPDLVGTGSVPTTTPPTTTGPITTTAISGAPGPRLVADGSGSDGTSMQPVGIVLALGGLALLGGIYAMHVNSRRE